MNINDLREIEKILYAGNIEEGLVRLNNFLNEINMLTMSMNDNKRNIFLNKVLVPMFTAMDNMDSTLLADIIEYELMEYIEV